MQGKINYTFKLLSAIDFNFLNETVVGLRHINSIVLTTAKCFSSIDKRTKFIFIKLFIDCDKKNSYAYAANLYTVRYISLRLRLFVRRITIMQEAICNNNF